MKSPLILASASPQRRKLLQTLKIRFRVVPSHVPENTKERRPRRIVEQLALRKARAVAATHPTALILGADTIVVRNGGILLKPEDRKDSERILSALNGHWHRVYTGVALVDANTGKSWREVSVTRVKARTLSESELKPLIGKHMDKAGAYAVQNRDDPFIEKIVGPLDNVIGLPLSNVRNLLKRASRFRQLKK